MPYVEGQTVHDADSHVMELPGTLERYADPAWRDGYFAEKPMRGLRAFARVYAGWAQSQTFYRQELWRNMGFTSLEDFLVRGWEGNFLRRAGEDLLSMVETWKQSDISDNTVFNGDLGKALGVDNRWAFNIVKQVGNFAEVWDRNIGPLEVPRSVNNLWNKGGLQYPPPMR